VKKKQRKDQRKSEPLKPGAEFDIQWAHFFFSRGAPSERKFVRKVDFFTPVHSFTHMIHGSVVYLDIGWVYMTGSQSLAVVGQLF
jgi:hypothetical protein